MNAHYHRAAVLLRHAKKVIISAHTNPDGDAIGSVLALTLALRDAGISVVPTLADDTKPPATYSFLPGFALFIPAIECEVPDLFVALDTASVSRLASAERLAKAAANVIVIDHHPDGEEFGTVSIIDSSMASTTQLVWRLIQALEIKVTPEIAQCCYVGLLTDTGRFAYSNTTPAALRDAATMIEAGVDPAETARLIYQERSTQALELEARVLSRLSVVNNGRVAYSWYSNNDIADTGAIGSDTEELPDSIRRLGGVDVVVMFRVSDGTIRANLRSKTGFDVSRIARMFGGGGHMPAAGFTFSGNLEDLLPQLFTCLPGSED